MKGGRHDGSNRHDYFQGVSVESAMNLADELDEQEAEEAGIWVKAYDSGSLGEALELVRSFVNETRVRYQFTRDPHRWNQTCVAMDVLADTHLALHAYIEEWGPTSPGLRYIAAYGSLQALFLQQDALTHLCESLGNLDPVTGSARLKEFREIRNRAIGHPTKLKRSGDISYHLISRITMSSAGFQMISHRPGEKYNFEWVPIQKIIREQEEIIREMLLDLHQSLSEEDRVQRKKHRDVKLSAIFEDLLYAYEKIAEDISSGQVVLAPWGMDRIEESLTTFEATLKERGLELSTYDSINDLYEELKYPMSKLRALFSDEDSAPDRRAAAIFLHYIRHKIDDLRTMAREIDEDYERD